MSAEIIFRFASAETGAAFVVPMTAVLPNPVEGGMARVFVFDPGTGLLEARDVQVTNVKDNRLQIIGDIAEGEVIATAGISFLHDGMEVELFDPALLQ